MVAQADRRGREIEDALKQRLEVGVGQVADRLDVGRESVVHVFPVAFGESALGARIREHAIDLYDVESSETGSSRAVPTRAMRARRRSS